ncbi:DNA repair protein RecO [Nannocystaceae bacterium ST9]
MQETVSPAIVLRTHPAREADLIVVLLTEGRGRVECHARGARKSRRRFPGGLPIGARGEATIGPLRRGSLPPLEGFAATHDHAGLGRDLEAFAFVHYLCELSDQLVSGSVADPRSFAILDEAIAAIVRRPQPHPMLLRRCELGLIDALGWLPALDRCGVCGAPADRTTQGIAFSLARGGTLCLEHGRGQRRLPAELPSAALELLAGPIGARELPEPPAPEIRRGLRDLGRELIEPHLRSPLRSLAFFAQLPARRQPG